jgi:hypothetical protein
MINFNEKSGAKSGSKPNMIGTAKHSQKPKNLNDKMALSAIDNSMEQIRDSAVSTQVSFTQMDSGGLLRRITVETVDADKLIEEEFRVNDDPLNNDTC